MGSLVSIFQVVRLRLVQGSGKPFLSLDLSLWQLKEGGELHSYLSGTFLLRAQLSLRSGLRTPCHAASRALIKDKVCPGPVHRGLAPITFENPQIARDLGEDVYVPKICSPRSIYSWPRAGQRHTHGF